GKLKLEDSDFALGSSFELFSQVGSSALVTDGTGRVMSNITTNNSQIFPVGNTNYTPIIITNLGTSDEFSVGCIPEVLSNGEFGNVFPTNVVNTTWLIEEAVAGGTNVILTAQWTSADELPNFDRSSTFLSRYDGTAWDSSTPTPASGTDPYTITRAGVTTFSPFAVGTSFVPDFSCVANNLELNEVALASGTYSTQQSIESTNLIEAGSTADFIAANVIELKVGFHAENGSTFSAVIDDCALTTIDDETIEQRTDHVTESMERTSLPLLLPNPVGQHLNIRDGIGQAMIYNMLGQQIQAFEIIDELHSLDVSDLVSGQYVLLILRESGERVTLSFVK
ncbi:MAG: T9SS type A sorting domain-containing protein, partial [Bacteroidota bacterium]